MENRERGQACACVQEKRGERRGGEGREKRKKEMKEERKEKNKNYMTNENM
jgi:hypothetical protein